MGQAEQQLVREGYAAFARKDLDWLRHNLHPEFELHTIFVGTGSGVYRGPEAVLEYAAEMADAWEQWDQEVVDVVDAGEHVVAILNITARGRGSGVTLEQPFAVLWRFRDGKAVLGRSYPNVEEGLRAAGLEP